MILGFLIFLPFSSCSRNYDKEKFQDIHPENRPPLEMRTVQDAEIGLMVLKHSRWDFLTPSILKNK